MLRIAAVFFAAFLCSGAASAHAGVDRAKVLAHLSKNDLKVRLKAVTRTKGSFRTTVITGNSARLARIYKKLMRGTKNGIRVHGPIWREEVVHPELGPLVVTQLGPTRKKRATGYELRMVDAETSGDKITRIHLRSERFTPVDPVASAVRGTIFLTSGAVRFSAEDPLKILVGEAILRVLTPAELGAVVEAGLAKQRSKGQARSSGSLRAQQSAEDVVVNELIGEDALFPRKTEKALFAAFSSGNHPWVRPGVDPGTWVARASELAAFAHQYKISINPLALARLYSDAATGLEAALRARVMNEFPVE